MVAGWKEQVKYCSKEKLIINYSPDFDDEPIKLITEDMLFEWQKDMIKLIESIPDDRTIHWFWESIGKFGKTVFCKYLICKYNVCYVQKGSYANIMNHVYNTKNVRVFIIDIPRKNKNNVGYDAIESIKSGIIFNSKYETGCKVINSPHIFVFSNFEPETDNLSADRWNIKNLRNETFEKIDLIDNDLEL